jgi:ribosomal-protein-alanine N-acetyltransferase
MNHCGTKWMKTKRLILRRFEGEDADAMYCNWANNPTVTRYLSWKYHENVLVTKKLLAKWVRAYEEPSFYAWAIVHKELEEPIGYVQVIRINETIDSVTLEFCIGKNWWRQGYCSEALTALFRFFFTQVGVNRIEAWHDHRVDACGALMQKCQMTLEGRLREAAKNSAGYYDIMQYSILAKEWHGVQEDVTPYRIEYIDNPDKLQRVYAFAAPYIKEQSEATNTLTFWEGRLADKSAYMAFAAIEDQIIACVLSYAESSANIVITFIGCAEEQRNQGIGKDLLYVIEKNCARMGYFHITLAADAQSEGFFTKNGYQPIFNLGEKKILQKIFQ